MMILAFEFSSEQRSVALSREGVVVAEAVESGGYRVTNAFGLTEKVLAEARAQREEVEAIAVGLGPGSYTGIRAAIALAQGWQLATGVKLLGVGSADCLARQAQAEGVCGRVNVVIDAQRGEFYLAAWDISATERRLVTALKIVPAAEVESLRAAGGICIGPEREHKLFPRAATVAELAAERRDFVSGEAMEPIYLRETTFVKAPPPRQI